MAAPKAKGELGEEAMGGIEKEKVTLAKMKMNWSDRKNVSIISISFGRTKKHQGNLIQLV